MSDFESLLKGFHKSDFFWEGVGFVPWLGQDLQVLLEAEEVEPGDPLLSILRAVLSDQAGFRDRLEAAVFKLYTDTAPYDTIDYGTDDEGRELAEVHAPRLTAPSEVWQLHRPASLYTCDWNNDPVRARFELQFKCDWDREHGVKVKVERWKVVRVT